MGEISAECGEMLRRWPNCQERGVTTCFTVLPHQDEVENGVWQAVEVGLDHCIGKGAFG